MIFIEYLILSLLVAYEDILSFSTKLFRYFCLGKIDSKS